MYVLTVDTSTPQVTAGIVKVAGDNQLETVALESHLDARAHNEVLTPLILQCLSTAGIPSADLAHVVVGCGPGPFTGLRVGMATAASFAAALRIPCHGVCSLDALVHGVGADATEGDALAITDARRREVYFAAYRDGKRVFGPAVAKAADVLNLVCNEVPEFKLAIALGSEKHCAYVVNSDGREVAADIVQHFPTAIGLAAAAGFADSTFAANPEPLVPLYLRRPDAVPPKAKPQSPAIPVIDVEAL